MTVPSKENKIEFAGDVNFETCVVTNYDNEQLDILPLVSGFTLFEDLYSPFLTAELQVLDNIGLAAKLPFRGEELITITIKDPFGAGLHERTFFVYKLKDKISIDTTYTYTLCLISIEAIHDLNIKISKFYSGLPSEIAKEVISKEGFQTEKLFLTEESKNSVSFISNYWSPLEIMMFLCSRSVSKYRKSPSFLFYETKNGFRFMSLDLLTEQESTHRFHRSNRNNADVPQELEKINELYIDESFDYITRIRNGAYGSRMLLVNPLSKSYLYRSYDFTEANTQFARLNDAPFNTDAVTRSLNSRFDVRTAPTSTLKGMASDNTMEWFQQRRAELMAKSSQKITIEVAGRFNISVGDVTDIFIYNEAQNDTQSGERDLYALLDKSSSGRYIITAIVHKVNRKEHKMLVELSKDSMMKEPK